jgi:hypothetical protein
MTIPDLISPNTFPVGLPSRVRVRFGLVLTLFGLLVFLIGARPSIIGMDRSPVVGIVQLSVFLVGLGIICIGGYICLMAFWKNGNRTIAADIGSRLVATGYVVSVFSGMADYFGFGTRAPPLIPFFGPWQATGVQVGELLITVGFLLLIPIHRLKKKKEDESSI